MDLQQTLVLLATRSYQTKTRIIRAANEMVAGVVVATSVLDQLVTAGLVRRKGLGTYELEATGEKALNEQALLFDALASDIRYGNLRPNFQEEEE